MNIPLPSPWKWHPFSLCTTIVNNETHSTCRCSCAVKCLCKIINRDTNLSITSNMKWSISNKNNQTARCTIHRPTNFLQKQQTIKYFLTDLNNSNYNNETLPMQVLAWQEKMKVGPRMIQSSIFCLYTNGNTNYLRGWIKKYSNKSFYSYCLTTLLVYNSKKIVGYCWCKVFILSIGCNISLKETVYWRIMCIQL